MNERISIFSNFMKWCDREGKDGMNLLWEEDFYEIGRVVMDEIVRYEILKKKFKMAVFNPLLIGVICVIAVLVVGNISYESYNQSGKYISYLLTPATVCLAVPLYEQLELLKKNLKFL